MVLSTFRKISKSRSKTDLVKPLNPAIYAAGLTTCLTDVDNSCIVAGFFVAEMPNKSKKGYLWKQLPKMLIRKLEH